MGRYSGIEVLNKFETESGFMTGKSKYYNGIGIRVQVKWPDGVFSWPFFGSLIKVSEGIYKIR